MHAPEVYGPVFSDDRTITHAMAEGVSVALPADVGPRVRVRNPRRRHRAYPGSGCALPQSGAFVPGFAVVLLVPTGWITRADRPPMLASR
jgi:hypothetical protein